MKDVGEEKRWVLCPWCGAKTRLQILRETELVTFPLFCPKCRHESIINAKNFIIETVETAGPNPCPPMVVGVGIGGTFEKCALMAKDALTREVGTHSDIQWVKDLEEEMLETINKLGIGPGGLGGTTTALAVNVNTYPTHIAGLPVGINICCHVNRHIVREV